MEWSLEPAARLRGQLRVPGDKSIGHRALLIGAIADGDSVAGGLSHGEDVASTAGLLRALGVEIEWAPAADGVRARVRGRGLHGLQAPVSELDCGNSGTTMRLVAGLLAGQAFGSVLTGDESLLRRPMRRIAEPLRAMGATVELAAGDRAPVRIAGGSLRGIEYRPPMASAQVKSCILLAGLYADGPATVLEPRPTRDHSERMLAAAGVDVGRDGERVRLVPPERLGPLRGTIPGDVSSAAYLVAAATLFSGARVRLTGVGVNPTRAAFLQVLRDWGAALTIAPSADVWGEPVADLEIEGGDPPRGGPVAEKHVPILIDELPLLGLMGPLLPAGVAVRGAAELRVKESDRIATTCAAIRALGGEVDELDDGFEVRGGTGLDGGTVDAAGDHRIALAAAAVSVAARGPVRVVGAGAAAVSWPGFDAVLAGLAR